jgi:HemY protein
MKMLLIALLVLAVAAAVVSVPPEDNGYVLLSYGPWTVETSLVLFLILNLILFVVLYLAIRTLIRIWTMPRRIRGWKERRGARRARRTLTQGLVELSEGSWKAAEKNLMRHVQRSDTPLLNYLAAAKAAQQQGAHERRNRYLKLAHRSTPSADIAVGLTQAELQLAHEQLEQALATLRHLQGMAPHHGYVLKLLKDLYLQLQDWTQLQRLLPELRKRKVIDAEELRALETLVYRKILERADNDPDPERLVLVWGGIPKGVRKEGELIADYARRLMDTDRGELAEPLLRESLQQNWDGQLAELYGLVEGKDIAKQLAVAESWLTKRPENPVLLLALGRLSLRGKLWGKARSYLEASIGAIPSAEAYRELGQLLERLGENEAALENYRAGLELTSGGLEEELEPIMLPAPAGAETPLIPPAADHALEAESREKAESA